MSILQSIKEFIILIRIQQLGTSVTPIIGALSVKGIELDISSALLLFIIAVIVNIGGQVHNDLCDIEIDKQSKELQQRPLVKGTISLKTAKIIVLVNLFIVIVLLLYFYPSFYALIIIITSFFFGTLYNIYSKKIPGADIFLSLSMALFFLFGAIVVTEDFRGFHDISLTTWILFFLVFIHVFLMDALGGGLKDAENDRKSGAKTLAVALGVKTNYELSTLILTFSLYTVFNLDYNLIQLIIIILLLIGMVISTIRLLSMKVFNRKKIKYINRNHELFGYMLVPMILIDSTGIFWFLFLMILPILWFIIFNFILYGDSWRNPKNF